MQTPKISPSSMQQLIKGDRSKFMAADDNMMMKQIQATHAPDGREVDVRPLLNLVEDILMRSTPTADAIATVTQAHLDHMEEKTNQASFMAMLDALSFTIDRISCEIASKSLGGIDGHGTTVSLFNMLSSFSWDAKLVLTLAAFALNYGEFWLLAQIYSTNQLAKSMAILRQLPMILEHSGPLKPRFDALNSLIKAMLDVTRCIVEFKDLPSMYITEDVPAYSAATAHIPTAVYWTIRAVVCCAAQISGLTSMGHEYGISTAEAWELSTLAHKLNNINDHLKKQLGLCHQHIDEKRHAESYHMLVNLFEMIHIDNLKVLKALIYPKDDLQPLVDGTTKRRVNVDVLRRKNVLLLISGLDISHDELSILEQIYNESRQHATRMENPYEVVWIPIVDRPGRMSTDPRQKQLESGRSIQTIDPMQKQFESGRSIQTTDPMQKQIESIRSIQTTDPMQKQFESGRSIQTTDPMQKQIESIRSIQTTAPMQKQLIEGRSVLQLNDAMLKQFESLQSAMPWYTVYHPSIIDRAVIRFVKEAWHFRNRPILVVLDPQGRVVCPNAIHMMWIWGSNAFPFTSLREEILWKDEAWRLELLVDGIDPTILNWIREGKYIFLYGGEDIEWIRKFTATARAVAAAARIPLEMVYVGKSTKREQVRRVIATITVEKLSYCWQDLTTIWFFWTRLESMLFSKIQQGRADDQDTMTQEIKKLLSYDKEGGWAVLSKGSSCVINGHGTTVLPTLLEYDLWKEHVPVVGFDVAIKDHHDKLHGVAHPCCRFEFPSTAGRIPENMKCPECLRIMEKFITFLCCHDESAVSELY